MMNFQSWPWIEQTKVRTLDLMSNAIARVPEQWWEPLIKRWLASGIVHADGVDFVSLLAVELRRRWPDLAPMVRRRFVENMFGNVMWNNGDKRRELREELGSAPLLMVISPTMRCNLKCEGCYSANYDRSDVIDTATFHRIIEEAKQLGIHFIVISGGEPFMRSDLLEIFERHHDVQFLVYTNSTIIYRDNLAPKLAELGNVMPAISVEGYAYETDARRGKGTFNKIIGAMSALRREGVLFGYSATPMRHNNDLLVSDEFVDYYRNLGCFFGWYFHYMPVGRDPNLDLMPTVDQRKYRMERIREIRKTKNIVVSDFWTDGTLVGGCLSAGRVYFHINAQGGVEPCVFHQFSVDNVMNKSLREALNSDYFRFIRTKNDDQKNLLTPCPVCDNPQILREAVQSFHPEVSQIGGYDTIEKLAEGLDDYSRKLHETMDPIWEKLA